MSNYTKPFNRIQRNLQENFIVMENNCFCLSASIFNPKIVYKSTWAHPLLVTEIDPSITRRYMKIELDATENDAYTNFVESIRSDETRRGYTRNLTRFLNMIPDDIFEQYLGEGDKIVFVKEDGAIYIKTNTEL